MVNQRNKRLLSVITSLCMGRPEKALESMRNCVTSVRYDDVFSVCKKYFGKPRQHTGSHAVFKTPWAGDPRVNIQKNKDGTAKPYQVRQVLAAIDKYEEEGRADVS